MNGLLLGINGFSLLFTMDIWNPLAKLHLEIKETIDIGLELLLFFEFQTFADLRYGQRMYRKSSTLRIVYLIILLKDNFKRSQLKLFTESHKLQATTYPCTPAVAFQAPLLFQRLQPLSSLWSQFRLRGPWWPGKVYTVLLFKVKTILDNSMFKPQLLRFVVDDYIVDWVSLQEETHITLTHTCLNLVHNMQKKSVVR